MTGGFIHVYLDEDVDVLIASLLRSRGFEATTAQQAGQLGKTDAQQLEYATSQEAAILTHNRIDFENLAREYFEQERLHYGIIIVVRNPYQEIVRRLLMILTAPQPMKWKAKFFTFESSTIANLLGWLEAQNPKFTNFLVDADAMFVEAIALC
jgi:predicted nuclease of predicted toxin-antitoxin system